LEILSAIETAKRPHQPAKAWRTGASGTQRCTRQQAGAETRAAHALAARDGALPLNAFH